MSKGALVRWNILGFVALAVVSFVTASTANAFPTDWKQKPYFDPWNSELKLPLTQPDWNPECDWKGPAGGVYITNVEFPDYNWNCLNSFMWAKTCKGGAQSVEFTKKVYLPGKALDLDASLFSYGDRTMSMGIDINGSVALSAVKTVHKRDLRGKEALFKLGMNTITVHAKKPKTGTAECNRNGTEYAVFAQIYAKFAADMRVAIPPQGSTTSYMAPLVVSNAGPSNASLYSVGFGVYTSHLVTKETDFGEVAILITGPGIDISECLYSYSSIYYKSVSYTGYSTSCPVYEPLRAGQSRTYHVTFAYKDPGGSFFEQFPVTWGVASDLHDPKQGNNGGTRLGYACRPAHPPECKTGFGRHP